MMLREMLSANEIAMVALNETLGAVPEQVNVKTSEGLTNTQQALATQLQALQAEVASHKADLSRLQKSVDAQGVEVSALRGVRRELSTVRASLLQVEGTVSDLYIIERGRLAKQVMGPKTDVVAE